ncbi:MAG: hypothetical protein V7785_06440 [Bermanella sp.]
MNLEKSKKRISKKAKMGFQGYPTIEITYYGPNDSLAIEVLLQFVVEEGAEPQIQKFVTKCDIREDEAIQSAIVKTIERSGAQSVSVSNAVRCSVAE